MGTDPTSLLMLVLLVPVLLVLNGIFAAAELALGRLRPGRLEGMAQEGRMRIRLAQSVAGNLRMYLTVCQLGITFTSLLLGYLGIPVLMVLMNYPLSLVPAWPPVFPHLLSLLTAFCLMALLHAAAGEELPRRMAARRTEPTVRWLAGPLALVRLLLHPLALLLHRIADGMVRLLDPRDGTAHPAHDAPSEDEIRSFMKATRSSGVLDPTELMLVDNIFDFSETCAREIMIPRTEMVCLYAGRPFRENMAIAMQELLTRYPVCDPDKDRIIGFIHIKDLLQKDSAVQDIRPLIRPLLRVPESIPISSLLRLMQKQRTHLVLLMDEYGGTSGLVTVEDILEEIVGEIQDEFDEERPAFEERDGGVVSVDGLLLIEEVNERLGLSVGSAEQDTIGGWLSAQVDIPPRRHQSVHCNGFEFIVEDVDRLRISRITIRPSAYGTSGGEEARSTAG